MKRTMLTALIVMYAAASAHAQSFTAGDLTPAEAKAIAQEGYVFGLPLVYIAVEADVLTNVAKPEGGRAPFNQFDHHREFPDAANNKIVGMNVDTLYSLAHLDLSRRADRAIGAADGGQSLVDHADHRRLERRAGRARLAHASGARAGNFALVGPNFKGTLPGDVEEIRVDTSLVRPRRANVHRREGRLRRRSIRFRTSTS